LRCLCVFFRPGFGVRGGIDGEVVSIVRKCFIFRGFRLRDVILQEVIRRLLAGSGSGVVRPAEGIIGVRLGAG
jgi:hypothetical protein